MVWWVILIAIGAGALGQFLDTVAGMGFGAFSGSIMLAGGVTPAVVVATVNLAKVGSGMASALSHLRFGNVERSWVLPLAVPAVAGGVLAGLVLTHLPVEASRFLVPVLLLGVGFFILRRFLTGAATVPPVAGGSDDVALAPGRLARIRLTIADAPDSAKLGVVGFSAGVLNGMSGAFGPIATSSVILLKGGHPRHAIGTVNFVEFFVAFATAATVISQIKWSGFGWALPVALMAGSFLTAPLGAYLARHMPARVIGVMVGAALVGLNLWTIARAVL